MLYNLEYCIEENVILLSFLVLRKKPELKKNGIGTSHLKKRTKKLEIGTGQENCNWCISTFHKELVFVES